MTSTDRPLEGCPVRPLSGDLTCIYPAGHDEPHRNFQGIAWTDGEPTPGRHARRACGVQHPRFETRCARLAGHDGDHGSDVGITWADEPRDLVAERLETEAAIAGPRVMVGGRRAGKTSQALDTMTAHANALADELAEVRERHAAAVEYVETLERERDEVRRLAWGILGFEDAGYVDTSEPDRCGDRHEWSDGSANTCNLEAGHVGWHSGLKDGGCWPRACGDTIGPVPKLDGAVMTCTLPAGHPAEHYDRNASWFGKPAPCDATLDVDYGDQGQTIPCEKTGDHGTEHAGGDNGVVYRWHA